MQTLRFSLTLLFIFALCSLSGAAANENDDILPPPTVWNGKSRALVVARDDPWITPSELSNLTETPSYDETVAWLRKLVDSSPELNMVSIGQSLEGRDIFMVIASADHRFSPDQVARKPLLLAQAGIHSGEIDGKDAGLMLLRDMTVGKRKTELLDAADFLFIPILNVDGHELSSAYNRINQRGPRNMGWRTNARNLNLNRDYGKLETREVQAMMQVFAKWKPDLYLDLHVTDGQDAQYDVTFGFNTGDCYSPAISKWLSEKFRPRAYAELESMGHIPGPFFFAKDTMDISRGVVNFQASMRYSNGYGDVRHMPTILVENHSLKPYDQRVLGTYVFLETTFRILGESHTDLRKAVAEDMNRRPQKVVTDWKPREKATPLAFKGISFEVVDSEISGSKVVRWSGQPKTYDMGYLEIDQAKTSVSAPRGYWVPSNWPEIIEKLRLHGVAMTILDKPREVQVEMYRLIDAKLQDSAYEGKVGMTAAVKPQTMLYRFPKGSAYISTDQPLSELIVLLLEPESPESFFQWGYFPEILQLTEYFETYMGEPLAQKMITARPELKAEFEADLARDPELAKNPRARLHWFYERSPYFDPRFLLYPIGRELNN